MAHNHLLFDEKFPPSTTLRLVDDKAPAFKSQIVWEMVDFPQAGDTFDSHTFKVRLDLDMDNTVADARTIDVTYSLLTLGFQAVEWDNEIIEVTAASGEVWLQPRSPDAPFLLMTGAINEPIFRAGLKWDPKREDKRGRYVKDQGKWNYQQFTGAVGRNRIDEDGIWMMQLKGARHFEFKVRDLDRPRVGMTKWSTGGTVGGGHDNEPPKNPPD